MEKMTKREMFEMIKGVCANDTRIVEFCEHEIELLNRKSSKNTQTKTQIENENIDAENFQIPDACYDNEFFYYHDEELLAANG